MKPFFANIRKLIFFLRMPSIANYFTLGMILAGVWFAFDIFLALFLSVLLNKLGAVPGTRSTADLPIAFLRDLSLSALLLSFIVLGGIRAGLLFYKNFSSSMLYQEFLRKNRELILKYSLRQGLNVRSFETVTLFTEDLFQAGGFYQQLLNFSTNVVLLLFLTAVCLYKFSWIFAETGVLFMVCLLPLRLALKKSKLGSQISNQSNRLAKTLLESLRNTYLINLYRLNKKVEVDTSQMLQNYKEMYGKYSALQNMASALPYFFGSTAAFLILYLNIHSLGNFDFLAFFYLSLRVSQVAADGFGSFSIMGVTQHSLSKLVNWYEEHPEQDGASEEAENGRSEASLPLPLTVSASGLSYSVSDRVLFDSLSFDLKMGNVLFIEGPSGAGKSTLLDIILGLKKPLHGEVLMNDVPVHLIKDQICKIVSYVGPDSLFFEDSIRNNLLWGNAFSDKITDDEIWRTLQKCGMEKEVREKPGQLDFQLGEFSKFSTGQKQRLALTRAFLRHPKLLVLDEATANIDPTNERKIMEIVQSQREGMITAVISHKGQFSDLASHFIKLGQA